MHSSYRNHCFLRLTGEYPLTPITKYVSNRKLTELELIVSVPQVQLFYFAVILLQHLVAFGLHRRC
jgi:hypothetical protein